MAHRQGTQLAARVGVHVAQDRQYGPDDARWDRLDATSWDRSGVPAASPQAWAASLAPDVVRALRAEYAAGSNDPAAADGAREYVRRGYGPLRPTGDQPRPPRVGAEPPKPGASPWSGVRRGSDRPLPTVVHDEGTAANMRWHQRNKEQACDPCREWKRQSRARYGS